MLVPRSTIADDTYNGWFIPKGTVVLANAWSMSRDSSVYPDPEVFRPERFLGENPQMDPENIAFGYGRRYVFFMVLVIESGILSTSML